MNQFPDKRFHRTQGQILFHSRMCVNRTTRIKRTRYQRAGQSGLSGGASGFRNRWTAPYGRGSV